LGESYYYSDLLHPFAVLTCHSGSAFCAENEGAAETTVEEKKAFGNKKQKSIK
jgi:hypothetical protein